MKPRTTLLALWAATQLAAQAQVGIGTTTPDASAQLDVTSTTLGFLPPRMTQAQREAIEPATAGLLVYQTNGTTPGLYIYDGTSWATFSGKESALTFSSPFSRSGDTITLATAGAATAGALTSNDWNIFNNKVAATRGIATTAPLTGGGDLSADLTLSLPAAGASADGYLSSTDWSTFNAKESALTFSGPLSRSDNAISLAAAGASTNGYLSSTDWAHFNTAYGWGNHASAGYLTSFTETDPLFAASAAQGIAASDITAWNAKVGGSGTANYVPAFTASGTLGNSALFSAATGNVGIGTTTPTAALNVLRTASTSVPALVIESSASLANNDIIRMQINGLTNGFRMFQDPSSNVIYSFERGNVGIGTTSPSLGLLQLTKTPGNDVNLVLEQSGVSTWDIRNSATSGNFGIYNGQLGTVSMAIDRASGNVGIGTTTPNELMSLVQSSTSDIGVGIYNSTPYSAGNVAGGYLNLGKYEAAGPAYVPMVQLVGYPVTQSNSSEGALAIKTRKNGALTTQVTILNTGNVGIGTATPGTSYKLDVAGAINATAITIGGDPVATSRDTYWSTAGSGSIQYSGGLVGVNTATPAYTLDVGGDLNVTGSILIDGVPLSGTGTVTSIAGSGGSTGLTVTGGPVTTAGTLTLGGTLALTSGGTGATTAAAARTNLGLGTAATLAATNANTASTVVGRDASGNFSAGTITASLTGTASKATNLVGGNSTTLYGAMPYQSGIDATTWVSPNTTTTKKFLRMTGSGTNGAIPAWDTLVSADIPLLNQSTTGTAANVTGTVAVANGGTGLTGYAVGDLPYASAATTLSRLTAGATGNALISGGVGAAPAWGKVGLTTHVSGILPVANGGTGTATGSITGTGALTLAAGGTDQNVTLTPTGTGSSMLGGNVAIGGTAAADSKLNIVDTSTTVTKGLNIAKSGAVIGNAYGAYLSASGARDWNEGVYALASGTGTYNAGVYASAIGASTAASYGVFALASGGSAQNIGILGSASGSTGTSSYGGFLENSATITTAKYGVYARAVGNSTGANYGGYFTATNTGGSAYALVTDTGNVGIGTLTPSYKLDVAGDVNITGSYRVNGAAIGSGTVTSVSGTAPISVTTGTSTPVVALTGTVPVANGGTGATTAALARTALSAAGSGANGDITSLTGLTTDLSVAQGGTGASTLTGYVKGSGTSAMTASATIPGSDISGNITGSAANVTGTVAVANGGTGAATAALARTALSAAASGANSDITSLSGLTTDITVAQGGTGASTLTANKVLVGNGASTPLQPTNLHWDNTNSRLGVGDTTPSYAVDVSGDVNVTGAFRVNGTALGGGTIGGSGSIGYLPLFTAGTSVGNSAIHQANSSSPLIIDSVDLLINTSVGLAAGASSKLNVSFPGNAGYGMTLRNTYAGSTYALLFQNSSGGSVGSVAIGTAGTNYVTTSDRRLKENITPTHFGLADLMKVQTVDYNFIADADKTVQTGFIAQDLDTVFPDAVTVGGDDAKTKPWSVDYGRLTPLLVKSIQDLKAENDALKADNEAIKAQNAAILKRLDALEAK